MNNTRLITVTELVSTASKLLNAGAVFCTATALNTGNKFRVIYHFNLPDGLNMTHLELHVNQGETVPSLSGVCLSVALVENEINELFGIRFENQSLDYKGGLMVNRDSPKTYMVRPPDYQPRPPTRLNPPCRLSCPAGIDIPRYIRLCGQGEFDAALALIRRSVPFPGVLGRVCTAPCESACRQAKQHEGLSVKLLKRLAYEHGCYATPQLASPTGKKIAVIGSGPAGLSAAYFLAMRGHSVNVFEALKEAGGCLRYGIPASELPRSVLDAEIAPLRRWSRYISWTEY